MVLMSSLFLAFMGGEELMPLDSIVSNDLLSTIEQYSYFIYIYINVLYNNKTLKVRIKKYFIEIN